MSDGEETVQYLMPQGFKRRLNVWLRAQGFAPELLDLHDEDSIPTYRLFPIPGDDADIGVTEAARLLFVSESTVRHWVETGRIRSRQQTRIPASEVERLAPDDPRRPPVQ
jgi:excisionase family DNA binding protein